MKRAAILGTIFMGFLVLTECRKRGCSDSDKSCQTELSDKKAWTREDTDHGIVPLLFMTKKFLYAVQPRSLTDVKIIWENPVTIQFFVTHWNTWLWYLSGYAACILAGVLFIIILPLVGLCFCCCRCCGKCGARYNDSDLKTGDCTRRTCWVFLFIFTSFMFAAVICALFLNFMIAHEIRDGGLVKDATKSLDDIESYRKNALQELRTYGLNKFNDTRVKVYSMLDKIPQDTVGKLENITDAGPAYNTLLTFAESLDNLSKSMEEMSNTSKELHSKIHSTFTADLENIKTNLSKYLGSVNCTSDNKTDEQMCERVLKDANFSVSNLTTNVNFSSVSSVDEAKSVLNASFKQQFKENVINMSRYSDSITQDIRNKTAKQIQESKTEVNKVQETLEEGYKKLENETQNLLNVSVAKSTLDKVQRDYVNIAGDYTFYIILALIVYLLLITLCFYTGLACGALCQQPAGPSGGCKDTVCGARFLMAAVYLGFLFCWLHMLFTMTSFAVGGPLHTELCRHAENLKTSQVVTKIEEKFRDDMRNFSFQQIYGNCSEDKAIYTAMNLEKIFNISEYLDVNKTEIPEFIESLKNLTIDRLNVTIVTTLFNETVLSLDSALGTINFTSYWRELHKPFINTNVSSLLQKLNQLEKFTNRSCTQTVNDLKRVQNSTRSWQDPKQRLSTAVKTAQHIVKSAHLNRILSNLTKAEIRINFNGSSEIKNFVVEVAGTILQTLQKSAKGVDFDVRNNAGKCKPLYSAVHRTIQAGCVYFLYPFNSLWFCFGWFLFFLLPSLVLATKLAKYYHIPKSPLTALGIVSSDTLKRQKANLRQKKIEIPRPSLGAEVHRNSANVEHYADFYQYSPDDIQLNRIDRRSFYPGWGSENPTFVADYNRDALHSPRSPGPAFGVPVMPVMGGVVPRTFKFDVDELGSPPPYSTKDRKRSKKESK